MGEVNGTVGVAFGRVMKKININNGSSIEKSLGISEKYKIEFLLSNKRKTVSEKWKEGSLISRS